ncbi:hypothetical protein HMPREF0972_00661 [Actinomyces sp. oral taxon 848 str. F0332]|nr:hypothetical protein HMPREF0972_00661 [Actinomyces sp. oral taxon 848 str. F0332]
MRGKRNALLKKLKQEAKARDLDFSTTELTNHTAVTVGTTSRTLGHNPRPLGHARPNNFAHAWTSR